MTRVDPGAGSAHFAAVLCELDRALDWSTLGRSYCHEGGENFFDQETIARVRDSGLILAGDLVSTLAERERRPPASCYVGAGVFELVPILGECLLLHRTVEVYSLPGPEPEEINRALSVVEPMALRKLPRIRTERFRPGPKDRYSHLWFVSVLTDPDHFPALHDKLYERVGTDQATGQGRLDVEEMRARSLIRSVLSVLHDEALLTSTDEELVLIEPACRREGLNIEIPLQSRISGIVGDRVRTCTVRRASARS